MRRACPSLCGFVEGLGSSLGEAASGHGGAEFGPGLSDAVQLHGDSGQGRTDIRTSWDFRFTAIQGGLCLLLGHD